MNSAKKIPSPLVSLFPIAFLVGMLFATIHTFGSDALSGGSQISLLATTGMCVFIGMTFYRIPWKDYELAITNNISGVATAIIILLIIGALSGTWMISGVVPTLIYYGMQIIHPNFFLASTCIICALVSVMTGSSWTTIATIGIALLGIGKAQGFEEGWIAGANHFGSLFRRQNFTVIGYHGPCLIRNGNTVIQPYPLYDDHHRPLSPHHPCHLYSNGTHTRNEQYTTDRGIYGSIGRQIQHYSLVTGCSRDYGNTDCPESAFRHHTLSLHSAGRDIRLHLPTGTTE